MGLTAAAPLRAPPGLTFRTGLCCSNSMLGRNGVKLPNATKTGTTIVGVVFKGGVVLGADTRATNGPIVADKNCEKIHFIADNIWCCGAGTAADTENTTGAPTHSAAVVHASVRGQRNLLSLTDEPAVAGGSQQRPPSVLLVLGSWVGAQRPLHPFLILTAPRMALPQDPSTDLLIQQLARADTSHGLSFGAVGMIATQLELHRMATKRQPRTATALTMLKRYLFQ